MGYLTAAQIEAAMTALATPTAPPDGLCTKTALPNPTLSEGIGPTTYSYLKIGNGSGAGRVTVLALAGMHAREWAQPDAVISFAQKLLAAYRGSTAFVIPAYSEGGNTFGPLSVDKNTIKAMLDRMDILLVPLANPDGRAFSQAASANNLWRKNRAPRPAGGNDDTVGVDINRNFDIGWDFDKFFSAAFVGSGALSASKDPADSTFIGKPLPAPQSTHPDSEPEVRNLIWILENHPVTYSVDLHSALLKVMHPWGIEQNGTVATQNFRNPIHDRGGTGPERDGNLGTAYSEFFPNTRPPRLLDQHTVIVRSICDGIRAATGRSYTSGGIADAIYPATGSFTDFHFSRQFTIAGSPEIHAFAAEFGDPVTDGFQPNYTAANGFPRIEREVHALLLRLLEAALPPPPAAPPPAGGGSEKKCFFSMAAADLAVGAAWLDSLRRGRAALLAGQRTRGAMLALDRLYRRSGDPLVPLIAERRWAQRAIAYGAVAPAAGLTALALKWRAR
jgi:Zinc carboxypeptidase